ncbi:MAG: TonB-dependent receptor [Burkholderia sp.]|nr:TonB-dependent receptor [Burkholderia sp.]
MTKHSRQKSCANPDSAQKRPFAGKKLTGPAQWLATMLMMAAIPVQAAIPASRDLAELSLEELANIRVISVSKKSESLADAPASIFVITSDEIRRSGATTLPEALRLAPNLQVARVDARNYAITARGFNSPFANKLLVLIDGRTVYTPLFSGVFWDAQDVVLEDIERIEVISGPGATLWGANAVNGVINVITQSASTTQGGLVATGASKQERNGVVRYGGALDNGGHYRVYGKYADNDDTQNAAGTSVLTGWQRRQTGFRTDWGNRTDGVTLHGDAYTGRLHQQGTQNIEIAGANLVGRLNRKLAGGSDISLQAYWDYTERNQPNAFVEHLHTLDLEFQHAVRLAAIHNVVYGAGYRVAQDRVRNDRAFGFLPGALNMHWGNVFVQDEIEILKNLHITGGIKLEDNNYTGTEVLPTLRIAYKPAENHLVWGSASRSVRSPSRIDRDFYVPSAPLVVAGAPHFVIAGGPDFVSEVAKVVEVGYRVQPTSDVTFSTTAFYAFYDKLRTIEGNASGLDRVFSNKAEGRTRGLEMWGSWQATPDWRLSSGLVAQNIKTQLKPGSTDTSGTTGLANSDPSHHWLLRSSYDISENKELDLTVRRVGSLRRPLVPAYTAMDVRFGWKLRQNLEFSVVGQNLLDPSHPELGGAPARSEFERSVFLKLLWRV